MSIPEPSINFATENAILLSFAEPRLNPKAGSISADQLQMRIIDLANTLRQSPVAELLTDLVPAPGSLLIVLNDGHSARRVLKEAEQHWGSQTNTQRKSRQVEIPVYYGGEYGPDLADVASHCGMSERDIINCHSTACYTVSALGFMPGFAYLSGLDNRLVIPRRKTPRNRIRAGSVAIGGTSTGVYPADSPGGWHIIGHTRLSLFNPDSASPTYLQPGDQVCFIPQWDEGSALP